MSVPMDRKSRVMICVLLTVFSLLLLGASRITDEMKEKSLRNKAESEQWRESVACMRMDVPIEHQRQWEKSVNANPKLFLEICTAQLDSVGR